MQTAASSAIVNGVPVIDVSALEQAADSSNESSATTEHPADSHETEAIEQTSPHFITVTGQFCYSIKFINLYCYEY